MGSRAMLIAASCTVLALASFAARGEATFPGKDGRIVFAGDTGGNRGGLVLIDPISGHRTVLTRSRRFEQDESGPAFSPNGRLIAYAHAGGARIHIDEIGVGGNNRRRLTKGPDAFDPAFSSSGRQIAFDSFRHRKSFIFIMRRDGSHVHRLGKGYSPAFSSRRGLIAFTVGRHIALMHVNGSHRLTIGRGSDPSFAPGGRRILFVASDPNGFDQLFVAHTDGSNRRQITSNTRSNLLLANPAYSPNGQQIVFEGEDITGGEGESDDIYLINADGTAQRNLTMDGGSASPDWGPVPR